MKTWKSIFKSKQVRKECLYSFLILMGIRLLATIPTPGTNPDYFKTLIHDNSALTFIDAMTGNGLSGMFSWLESSILTFTKWKRAWRMNGSGFISLLLCWVDSWH